LFKQRYTPLFPTTIPSKVAFQLKHEAWGHKLNEYWRLLRREVSLYLTGQKFLEKTTIPRATQRILWLAPSIRNIGDAIMAFSARNLIAADYQLDILLDPKVAPLFANDVWFNQVYTNVEQIQGNYDLILLDSVKSVTLKLKQRYFKSLAYCHFRGHFDGIEFNWILFSFHRINALLGDKYRQTELDQLAKPALTVPNSQFPSYPLIIAIGGEDQQRRVYPQWQAVIAALITNRPEIKIALVGNGNGLNEANELAKSFPQHVVSYVNQLSLNDTASVIQSAQLFAGCDGGLMHIASSFDLSGVALFGYFEPEYRLPLQSKLVALYHPQSVTEISPAEVIAQLQSKLVKR
jgi:heptosyltransferase-2